MISIPKKILSDICKKHELGVRKIFIAKCEVLKTCLNYYDLRTKQDKENFKKEISLFSYSDDVKIKSINWFLKTAKKESKDEKQELYKINKLSNPDNFFIVENRRFDLKQVLLIQQLKVEIDFLVSKIDQILSSKPKELLNLSLLYNNRKKGSDKLKEVTTELISFLFDYDTFSKKESIYTPDWGAYQLTNQLQVRTCLYCNRNYTLTVSYDDQKVIRPELDHFLPKSRHPILALSFYNLVPSCHTCNSNLKGMKDFSLGKYFHPYLHHFDEQQIRFLYKPKSPEAFFHNRKELLVKLDDSKINHLKKQINNNIELFKLNYIYNEHIDIVDSLIKFQRNSNKNRIQDIFSNVLVDNDGNKILKSESEVYELFVRNYSSEKDFHLKPMSKFERDIALELGLIVSDYTNE